MNKKLYQLFIEDQKDRKNLKTGITENDSKRKKEVINILNKKPKLTGQDYFYAAMIFHHGQKISDYKKAIKLAKIGAKMKNKSAKWLFAAATDRLLLNQGKKQKFGTQFKEIKGKWILFPIDKNTTDTERAKFNVIPIKEIKSRIERWNKQKTNPWQDKTGFTIK